LGEDSEVKENSKGNLGFKEPKEDSNKPNESPKIGKE